MADMTPAAEAAAFHGLATNRTIPTAERLGCALKALDLYETQLEAASNERDTMRAVVEAARAYVEAQHKWDAIPMEHSGQAEQHATWEAKDALFAAVDALPTPQRRRSDHHD
jgi:hypothetical protein